MVYHLELNQALGPVMRFGGLALDASRAPAWLLAAALLAAGGALFELARRRFRMRWDEAQVDIGRAITRKEAA